MYKLLFDSDALIKVTKTGFLNKIVEYHSVLITNEVYNEAVKEGKKRLYKDADIIDGIVKDKLIKIVKTGEKIIDQSAQKFGVGELSLLKAYSKKYLIVTDDLSFTLHLQKEGKPSISSAHLIYALYKKKKIKKDEACNYLDNLKQFIRSEIYKLVKEDIEGE